MVLFFEEMNENPDGKSSSGDDLEGVYPASSYPAPHDRRAHQGTIDLESLL